MNLILSLILGFGPNLISSLNPIEIKGNKFFDSVTGEQFFIKGVAYQPREVGDNDPLADAAACERDAEVLKELGVNTIRVYGANPDSGAHNGCMSIFESQDIYIILDLAIPKKSINRNEPRYDTVIMEQYRENIEEFSQYANTLAFFAGNEVTNDVKTTKASAYVKAALRDAKKAVKHFGRKIPVGYADNDDPDIRSNIQAYFNCGSDEERADFYGINIYSWCGESNFKESGYDQRTNELKNYTIPVILSEYGCNHITPRPFTEIKSLYGPDMNKVFSGGIAYEYTQEENNYGLVEIKGGELIKLPDFENFKSQLAQASESLQGINSKDYSLESSPSKCPSVSDKWESSEKLPPTPSVEACECALDTVTCQVNNRGIEKEHGSDVGKEIGYLCEQGHCELIASDPAQGIYGTFSTCNTTVANSLVFNQATKSGVSCDFNGFGEELLSSVDSLDQCDNIYKDSILESSAPADGSTEDANEEEPEMINDPESNEDSGEENDDQQDENEESEENKESSESEENESPSEEAGNYGSEADSPTEEVDVSEQETDFPTEEVDVSEPDTESPAEQVDASEPVNESLVEQVEVSEPSNESSTEQVSYSKPNNNQSKDVQVISPPSTENKKSSQYNSDFKPAYSAGTIPTATPARRKCKRRSRAPSLQ